MFINYLFLMQSRRTVAMNLGTIGESILWTLPFKAWVSWNRYRIWFRALG